MGTNKTSAMSSDALGTAVLKAVAKAVSEKSEKTIPAVPAVPTAPVKTSILPDKVTPLIAIQMLAALDTTENPALFAVTMNAADAGKNVARLLEISQTLKAANAPKSDILDVARESQDEDIKARVKKIDAMRARLEKEMDALTAIVAPPMTDDDKDKLTGEFASVKADVLAFLSILALMAKAAPNAIVSEAHDYLSQNLPTLRGTGISKVGSPNTADKLAGNVRGWVKEMAAGNTAIAGFQFGTDDNGKVFVKNEDGTISTLAARGRIGDTFMRAYRAAHAQSASA